MKGLTLKRVMKALEFKPFVIHNCVFCNYPCSFSLKDSVLGYDEGCHCITTEYKQLNGGWKPIRHFELEFYVAESIWREKLISFCEEVENESRA